MTGSWRHRTLRWGLLLLILALAAAPSLPLACRAVLTPSAQPVWTAAFSKTLFTGLMLGAGVALVSLSLGLPLGLLTALYRFPARRGLGLIQALPLLFPSFLPAIGWSNLTAQGWLPAAISQSGFAETVLVLGFQSLPLPLFATWAACRNLTASQIEVARLHGGEKTVLLLAGRACAAAAILTALLAGILSLSDPGAPLIFGCRSAAVEITTTFSALFDFELAARQCLTLAMLVLLLASPILALGVRSLASAVLAKQTRPATPYPQRGMATVACVGLILTTVVGLGLPLVGLCLPAITNPMPLRAWQTAAMTVGPTLAYCGGAAVIAVVLGAVVATLTRTDENARLVVVGSLLLLITLPPSLGALGVTYLAAAAPPSLDVLLRSDFTVASALGLRFLPIAAVTLMRSLGSLSPSWFDAARLHGVPASMFFRRVTLPLMLPGLAVALLVVAVLSAADISTTLLLQPPGKQSLPVAIFTIMANSPEGLVASICLAYILGVVALMFCGVSVFHWRTKDDG